jgi:hypothetical protein
MAIDWKDTLAAVAPRLATALGGPLAGVAVKAIEGVLGLGNSTPEQLAQAVSGASPDQLLALKKADQDFAAKMEELGVQDRDSARNREIQTKDHSNAVLGTVIIVGFLAAVGAVLTGEVMGLKDPNTAALIGTLIGYVSAKADQVVAYYFGSSRGSASKDETIKLLSR